jgi:hypothetical protein
VEPVFLPTYGSRLNWIEAEFAALRYVARGGTDHHSHAEQNTAIAAYVRWRNTRAQPKVGFAVGRLPGRSCVTSHYLGVDPNRRPPRRPVRDDRACVGSIRLGACGDWGRRRRASDAPTEA